MNETTSTIIRSILKVGGGFLVAKGLASESVTADLIGALVTIIGFVWGIFAAKKAASTSDAAPAAK